MKTPILTLTAAIALAVTGLAQTSVSSSTSTTTSAGTISEFSPNTIVIRSETSPEPVRYSYSKTTTYVDDSGAPVSMDTVKSGLPVTVHYVKGADGMMANRVIVHKRTTTTGGTAVEERKTSTTTTTTK